MQIRLIRARSNGLVHRCLVPHSALLGGAVEGNTRAGKLRLSILQYVAFREPSEKAAYWNP